MADKTLNDISKQISEQTKLQVAGDDETVDAIKRLDKSMNSMIKLYTRSLLDREEDRRESKKAAGGATRGGRGGSQNNPNPLFPFLGGVGLAGLLTPITAGIAALSAAMIGFRGWELAAISKLADVKNILPNTVLNGMTRLRNAAYAMFGLTPEGLLTRDAQGRFQRVPPITEQIRMRMNAVRIRMLNLFGIGADGKLLALRGDDGLFKRNIIGRVTFQIGRLLKPLMWVTEGIAEFATGTGAKLFGFIRNNIIGGAKVIGRMISKVLWPIGFLFSLFDGVTAFRQSDEEGFIARLGDGIGAFLGDFIGAPFDMLKSAVNWIWDNAFGVERDENGNVTSTGWASWASAKMSAFSFEETIGGIVSGMFGMIQGAVDWVKLLFTDPSAALDTLWTGLLSAITIGGNAVASFLDILWMPVNLGIDWITKKLGWREEDAPTFDLRESLTGWVTDFWNWFTGWLPDLDAISQNIQNWVYNKLPDWVRDNISFSVTNTNDSFTPTPDTQAEDALMSQAVTSSSFYIDPNGVRRFRSVDLSRDMQFDWDAYNAMNNGANPYGGQLIINNIDQSSQDTVKADQTVIRQDGVPASEHIDMHMSRQYMGIPGRGWSGF